MTVCVRLYNVYGLGEGLMEVVRPCSPVRDDIVTPRHLFSVGWVHAVAFSPSGNKLAWVGHDSSISVVDAENNRVMTTG